MSIHQKIQAYYDDVAVERQRYRSWALCYGYFRKRRMSELSVNPDLAAIQLGFHLAGWGMYRGSGFLLQHAYTVHRSVIDLIAEQRFKELWDADFGGSETDEMFVPTIHELIEGLVLAYKPFLPVRGSAQATNTLITKIILGTFGCFPVCDRYFIDGCKLEGLKYSHLDQPFIQTILGFCLANLAELRFVQVDIEQKSGTRYPLMKLVDMYFWQVGHEADTKRAKKPSVSRF